MIDYVDYIERNIAIDGDMENGTATIMIERPSDLSRVDVKDCHGNILATFRADKDGNIVMSILAPRLNNVSPE